MNINNCSNNNIIFHGLGTSSLNAVGNIMGSIENGGFLTSFLIQDGLGMTVPRTYAGFLRDKEITGEYNKQEGFEVLGREGLTGPCMMAVAPAGFYFASKIGQSTTINSLLIKYFGNNLSTFFDDKKCNSFKTPQEFKKEFYTKNIRQILENSLDKDAYQQKDIDFIVDKLIKNDNLNSKNKKNYKKILNELSEYIDNIRYNTSDKLENLQKIKLGNNTVKTTEALDGLVKYTTDTIKFNSDIEKLNKKYAEKLKYSILGKRCVTNVSILLATLGVLSVLPRIYARSNTTPGAKAQAKINNNNENKEENDKNIAFQGKGEAGIFERIGKWIDKCKKEFIHKEFEYDGYNFSNTLMTLLSLGGLLLPRGLRAYNRAPKDENNKKDLSEIWEIIIRDVTSSLAVVFAVPILSKLAVSCYENVSGFVFLQKDRGVSKFKQFLDALNPYGKTQVLNNSQIVSLYNNINTKEKLMNFCKFINNNDGSLYKIMSKLENGNKFLKNINVDDIKKLSRKEQNKLISSHIEKAPELEKLMKELSSQKLNKMTTFARGLTSIPKLAATVIITPLLLGWTIPRLTYKNTQRLHAKKEAEKQAKESQIRA